MLTERMRWQAATQRQRVDPPTEGLFIVIDYRAGRMHTVRLSDRLVVDMAAPAAAGRRAMCGRERITWPDWHAPTGRRRRPTDADGRLHHRRWRAAARHCRRPDAAERRFGGLCAAGPRACSPYPTASPSAPWKRRDERPAHRPPRSAAVRRRKRVIAPWKDRQGRFSWMKALVLAAAFVPASSPPTGRSTATLAAGR